MKIVKLELKNQYMSSNCYLLIKDKDLVIVDPGFEDDTLYNYIRENDLNLKKILLTHGHYDHWTGLEKLRSLYDDVLLYASSLDEYWYYNNPFTKYIPKIDVDLNNLDEILLLDTSTKIIKTPGHSKGSVAFLFNNNLISGDLLFFEGIGRYDLNGGNFDNLKSSIEKIYKLNDDVIVYPGHGRNTSIKYEKNNNPFINKNS